MLAQKGRRGAIEAAAEKRVHAFELRKRGQSFRTIAKAVGVSPAMAHRYVKETLDELATLTINAAEDLRAIELERLDSLLNGVWPAAELGDPQSVAAALKIGERRARLLGLDAPTKIAGHDGGPLRTFIDLAREVMPASSAG